MLLRESQEVRVITAPAAAVTYRLQSAIASQEQPFRIIEHLAIGELARLLHLRNEILAADLRRIEILIPLLQILDRSVDGAIAELFGVRHVQLVGSLLVWIVS